MGRAMLSGVVLVVAFLGSGARAGAAEPGVQRSFGIGGSLGAQVFSVSGFDEVERGLQVDFFQLHVEAAVTDRLGLQIWLPVSEMLIGAAAAELEQVEIRSSMFLVYRPSGDHGLFLGPGLGMLYIGVEEGSALGPEIGARLGLELSSGGRGFSTTFAIHPYYALLPIGSAAGSVQFAGIGFEIGFHYFGVRSRS